MPNKPTSLILNSPYKPPEQHWVHAEDGVGLKIAEGRRDAGYMVADPKAKPHQDMGRFIPLPQVNKIRQRVDGWRAAGYPGVTGITKALLAHWHDAEQRQYPFFFCQLEAIETLIWLVETADHEKAGFAIDGDGGEFSRLCCKLATGTGKTVVMAMLIAWQVVNQVTYKNSRFSKNILLIAPNLTVKERLAVLQPAEPCNYYDAFGIAPLSMQEKLYQGNVLIRNWHALAWETQQQLDAKRKKGQLRSVDKRKHTELSAPAYLRQVMGNNGMAQARNIIVINDEAHHAWRVNAQAMGKYLRQRDMKDSASEATVWVGGLDRIHNSRGILHCFDFSATPYTPSGKKTHEESLFGWTVTDFGLNDAIESGLVKTPRVVVSDDAIPDAKTYRPRLYHLYSDEEVKDDINRRAKPSEPLPRLLVNAYTLLGSDWEKTKAEWSRRNDLETPPVLITVANRTETAARIKFAFDRRNIPIDALCEPDKILHIDSKVLALAEQSDSQVDTDMQTDGEPEAPKLSNKAWSEVLRGKVKTVGQLGKSGEQIQNVISVGMLSEGWDARTVTHIMGLRAFTSQLLCEQVIGRGLRRACYEINPQSGLLDPEYVNVFGVPFSFLPHEEPPNTPLPPPLKTTIMPVAGKQDYAIRWPNVIGIHRQRHAVLQLNTDKVKTLKIDTANIVQIAAIAPTVNNKPDITQVKDIDLEQLMRGLRRQQIIFRTARDIWDQMQPDWQGCQEVLMGQLARIVEQFIDSECIQIAPALFNRDSHKKRLIIALDMSRVVRHIWEAIDQENTQRMTPIFDRNHPIRSTGDMRPWRTGKPCTPAKRSHINYCVYDSAWESSEVFELERNDAVAAWVKNDHLGFEVLYMHAGVVRKYRPDFLIRLQSGEHLVLEVKGQQTEKDDAKHQYMKNWVEAVNQHGGFGRWHWDVSNTTADIKDILARHAGGVSCRRTICV